MGTGGSKERANSFREKRAKTSSSVVSVVQPHTVAEKRSLLPHQSRIVQNFLLIWLESNIEESTNNYLNSITQLRSSVNTIKIFSDVNECENFLKHIKDERVFMIVTGALSQQIIPRVHDTTQLDVIYIFL